ncbi:MAG TPA: hypothetical protein VIH81_15710 [Roseiarcus sp.]
MARLVLRVAQNARAEADALNADEAELTPNPNATAAHLPPGKSALIIGIVVLVLTAAGALTHAFGQVMPAYTYGRGPDSKFESPACYRPGYSGGLLTGISDVEYHQPARTASSGPRFLQDSKRRSAPK